MPTMLRIDKKVRRIAYNILGVPANMQDSKKYKQPKEKNSGSYNELERVEPRSIIRK